MTNPLIDKYNELYNSKPPEPPKPPEPLKPVEKPKLSKFTTYDPDSVNDSFQQIAEKIQQGKAQVVSMNMEFGDHMNKLTFEVYLDT